MSSPVADIIRSYYLAPDASGGLTLPDGTPWTPHESTKPGAEVRVARVLPRVCMVPQYAFSSGPEAIELAASAGLILDPWQQLALILGLGETAAGKWAAFQVALIVARQNGKGSILEALELFWLFCTGEMLIGHSAHEYKTAMEAFRRVLALITNTDDLRKKVKKVINTNGEEGIELLTGQRLRFMARSKGAGRGFSFPKLVWDEGYALTAEQQDAQLPTLSAMENPQIWITSSPPLDSTSGVPLFRLRRTAQTLGAGLVFMDYGADGALDKLEEVDLDDPELNLKANPAAPHRISLEAMRRERTAMGDVGYARERLCIWPPDLTQGFGVISKEQWDLLFDPLSGSSLAQLVGRPCISVDVTPRNVGQVRASIGLAQRRQDGATHIELIKFGSGSDWLVSDLVKLVLGFEAMIAIDPGSPAGSVLPDLQEALRQVGLDPDKVIMTMAARDVAQAFGMIYDAATSATAETRSVTHLGQAELSIALGGAVKRPVGDGHAWDRRAATTDITPLVSVTGALWGLAKMGTEIEPEPMVVWV